jgi:Predicted transmembrane protein 161AB
LKVYKSCKHSSTFTFTIANIFQGKNGEAGSNGHFNVPRNIDLQLETAKVTKTDICQLRYYAEYQWLVDFAIYALVVYTLTEVNIFTVS